MVGFGVNVAPAGVDDTLDGCGAWRRLVLSGRVVDTVRACGKYHSRGWKVLGVATKQVMVEVGGGSSRETARRVFELFGASVDALQVWNEPDGGGDASDIASKVVYNDWLDVFRREAALIYWNRPLVAAGLVSGQPDWLRGVNMHGYALAIHPYDQRPYAGYPDWGWGNLPDLLDAYRPFLPRGTKYWLTECSRTTSDEQLQARYAYEFARTVAQRNDVEVCLWYCWKDWRQTGTLQPFGLVRENGSAKPTLGGWIEANMATDPQWKDDKQRIEEQISLLVENQRNILRGDWDTARILLDAIDPAMAGKWTNCHFTGCGEGG